MRTSIITVLALLTFSVANAQSLIDQVYKTITPDMERVSYSFQSIDGQSKIFGYGNGLSNVYDEEMEYIRGSQRWTGKPKYGVLLFIQGL